MRKTCEICEQAPAAERTNGVAHCRWENCTSAAANPFGIGDTVELRADCRLGEIVHEHAEDAQLRWGVVFPSGDVEWFPGDALRMCNR